mmetsp:Transcript_42623/g.118648  ORF Transcript_42623/g.118648 Transcript_42623/m.118648 type:complete len:401 (-) Transcript_42623:9-1211(-)
MERLAEASAGGDPEGQAQDLVPARERLEAQGPVADDLRHRVRSVQEAVSQLPGPRAVGLHRRPADPHLSDGVLGGAAATGGLGERARHHGCLGHPRDGAVPGGPHAPRVPRHAALGGGVPQPAGPCRALAGPMADDSPSGARRRAPGVLHAHPRGPRALRAPRREPVGPQVPRAGVGVRRVGHVVARALGGGAARVRQRGPDDGVPGDWAHPRQPRRRAEGRGAWRRHHHRQQATLHTADGGRRGRPAHAAGGELAPQHVQCAREPTGAESVAEHRRHLWRAGRDLGARPQAHRRGGGPQGERFGRDGVDGRRRPRRHRRAPRRHAQVGALRRRPRRSSDIAAGRDARAMTRRAAGVWRRRNAATPESPWEGRRTEPLERDGALARGLPALVAADGLKPL